jgi:uncharacterized protein
MRVAIHVRPGARAVSVGGLHGDALIVRVRDRAVDGKATAAALAAIAAALELPRRDVILVTGATSRLKIVEVPDSAAARIASLRDTQRLS